MPRISDSQIAGVAQAAGFRGADLSTAVAVAIAESGGNTDALNANDTGGTRSFGLWQINSVHTDLLGSGNWRNAQDNARMAFTVFQRQGWRAWGAFTNGSWLLFRARGRAAAGSPDNGVSGSVETEGNPLIPDSLEAPWEAVGKLAEFVTDRHTWLRVVTVFAGFGLLSMLVFQLVSLTPVGDVVKGTVKGVANVVPVGRATKAVKAA